jgi:hypothetical protein
VKLLLYIMSDLLSTRSRRAEGKGFDEATVARPGHIDFGTS